MIVVDAAYLTYRAYCANGTDAVAGASLSTLLRLLAQDPDVWLAWEQPDGRGAELRRAIYPEYKHRREPKPEDYVAAIVRLQNALSVLGIHQAWAKEGEGDDVAWTLVRAALARVGSITLWSRDKDWLQMLAHERVSMLLPGARGSTPRTVREADVPELLGVPATRVTHYLALAGDSADDVPGIPGIGAQRATALLSVCPDLVLWVLAGEGIRAVQMVAAADASLARHAQAVADNAPLLVTMVDLIRLRDVPLIKRPGRYDAEHAVDALVSLECNWARGLLLQVAPDDWS